MSNTKDYSNQTGRIKRKTRRDFAIDFGGEDSQGYLLYAEVPGPFSSGVYFKVELIVEFISLETGQVYAGDALLELLESLPHTSHEPVWHGYIGREIVDPQLPG